MALLLTSLLLALPALAAATDSQIADAIYIVEGGPKAKVPYGILSIKVKDKAHARRVCLRTISNSRARWIAAGKPGHYLDFLADRYCPRSVSKIGNLNWRTNIHRLIK